MKNRSILFTALSLFSILIFASCKKNNDENPASAEVAGYIYTTTNGESTNSVVRFTRQKDGSLTNEKGYTTNSLGGANVSAGGDAHGDFDSQGGVQIIGNFLLNVNAGGNQVSVFGLDRKTGDLTFKNNYNSGGTRPVSIAYTKKAGSADEYWVVVGNQWNNPNVQKDGAAIERYPNNAFHMQNLTLPDATDNERNIQLFSFNSTSGILTSVRQLDKYVRENGGPACVTFSTDGTKLAVGTWGIAHFGTQLTSVTEQHPSRVYIYNFSNGSISNRRFFEESGISGTIGLSWDKTNNSKLYASNFNLIPTKLNNSVTVLTDNGTGVTKTTNLGATLGSAIDESCWTTLSPSGDRLFVASFQTNLVSAFNITPAGITYVSNAVRSGIAPSGDSKELWASPDGRFLYNTGGLQSYSINRFDISSGITYKAQNILSTTANGAGIVGKYNFLGLIGYDL